MRNIRKSIFETNSSSVHALCIGKNSPVRKHKHIIFKHGSFGNSWDNETYTTKDDRASYLYELLLNAAYNDKVPFEDYKAVRIIKKYLEDEGVSYEFEENSATDESAFYDNRYGYDNILKYVTTSAANLMQYLFGGDVFILVKSDHYMMDDPKLYVVDRVDKEKYDCIVA